MLDNLFKEMLENLFWVSSASLPGVTSNSDWLRVNPEAFPGLWKSALRSDCILNNPSIIGKFSYVHFDMSLTSTNSPSQIL